MSTLDSTNELVDVQFIEREAKVKEFRSLENLFYIAKYLLFSWCPFFCAFLICLVISLPFVKILF